jgi:hypothetical protein
MAKYSMKVKGKEIGPAEVYAEPHTMSGKKISAATALMDKTGAQCMREMNISAGTISKGNYPETKTSGIKIRGTGAATKGTMARGPMA